MAHEFGIKTPSIILTRLKVQIHVFNICLAAASRCMAIANMTPQGISLDTARLLIGNMICTAASAVCTMM